MTPSVVRPESHEVSEAFVSAKVQFFSDVHLWPERQILDSVGWLKNFTDTERPHALNLLNVFLYFNESLVDALFRFSVQRLSAGITASLTSLAAAKARWRSFLSDVCITYVEGEKPNLSDSGRVFARKARQVLGIEESQIVEPSVALRRLFSTPGSCVLLVDDFVGSGAQMAKMWTRNYELSASRVGTFASVAATHARVIYVPLVATTYGLDNLATQCPELQVFPAHVLDEGYNLASALCTLWPRSLKPTAKAFLFETSKRAGIVDRCEHGWLGFHDLALPLAFNGSVPDATLPLYFWEEDGWVPLVRRT